MTGPEATSVATLVARGLAPHEARWLVEAFAGEELAHAVERRLAGEPLQYVIGHWPFRSLDLLVDERALIPRPETEFLVDVALRALGERDAVRVLDLGCGTGAIGLAVASELGARGVTVELVAVDVSADTLELARENAARCAVESVTFVLSDWYDALEEAWAHSFDLIAANPPYVGATERRTLDPVLDYEPERALTSDDVDGIEGFADVARVIDGAREWLTPTGVLVLEHGDRHGEAVRRRASAAGLVRVRDHLDLAGRDRVLEAHAS